MDFKFNFDTTPPNAPLKGSTMRQNKVKAIREVYLLRQTPEFMDALKELRAATNKSVNRLIMELVILGVRSEYSGCPEALKHLTNHEARLLVEDPRRMEPTE